MKCPGYQTNVKLDSKLYVKSFLGRYTCPSWLVLLFFAYCYIDRKFENNMPTMKIN